VAVVVASRRDHNWQAGGITNERIIKIYSVKINHKEEELGHSSLQTCYEDEDLRNEFW
jgi:hypothetical protein